MSEQSTEHSLDILGIKPVSDAINTVTEASVKSGFGFLRLICRPAAEEFGLLLQDNVKMWRATNAVKLVTKAETKFNKMGYASSLRANPRLVSRILEEGSWIEDDDLQERWAGLLASSCSSDGKDDSNLIFIHLLSQLTVLQARIIDYAIHNCPKEIIAGGHVHFDTKHMKEQEIIEAFGEKDFARLEREILHLCNLSLMGPILGYGPGIDEPFLNLCPSTLGIHLFVRCQGSALSPNDYFQQYP
ncbi:MAG: hypothetical protein JO316_09645 [Abitibacteriaceae bacterium]|nr:hypothetical protein [Abditibacteriaceae bacterium]